MQLERLQALLARLKRSVRHYRERLGDARVRALPELAALPLTSPEDLAATFPYGLLALPLREVMRIQSTVGPGGAPLVAGFTRNDLAHWGRLVARQFAAAAVTPHDVIQVAAESGALSGAHGYALGAECVAASIVAEDPYCVEHQVELLRNYRATVLVTSPTRAGALAAALADRHTDPHALSLRAVILSRPVPEAERAALRLGLFADVHGCFGVPEVMEPGLCVECPEGRQHVNEEDFLAEEVGGELVLTTLTREAMPLLRYRTRIAASLRRETCPCGRTGVRLEPGGRLDDRLLVNERWITRAQIDALLAATPVAGHPCRVSVSGDGVHVSVRLSGALFRDTVRALEGLQREVEHTFLLRLGVASTLAFVEPHAWGGDGANTVTRSG